MKIESRKLSQKLALEIPKNLKLCQSQSKYGDFVSVYGEEVYEKAENYGIYNDNILIGGFSVAKSGELFSIYKLQSSHQVSFFSQLVFTAANETKADKFYCFGGYLPTLAFAYNYRPICKMDFDPSYWKKGTWNYRVHGKPDVYFCYKVKRHTKSCFDEYRKIIPTINNFENAKAYRDSFIEF